MSMLAKIKLAEAQTALAAAAAAIDGAIQDMKRVYEKDGARAPINVFGAAALLGFSEGSLAQGGRFIADAAVMLQPKEPATLCAPHGKDWLACDECDAASVKR
jgi:hypothetical protein